MCAKASKITYPCPKCEGKFYHSTSNKKASFSYCSLCKGLWLSSHSLLEIFNQHHAILQFIEEGLQRSAPIKFECPYCDKPMQNGYFLDSKILIDQCVSCNYYFFDEKEINQIFDYLQVHELPKAEDVKLKKDELVLSKHSCPVCLDKPLFGLKNHIHEFENCFSCEGIKVKVEHMQKLAKKSLFGPSMFEFRVGGDVISFCRYCGQQQPRANQDCVKCGRAIQRLNCPDCNTQMSEYQLNDIVIDRCQMCNSLWLDHGEFEKVMLCLPDLKGRAQKFELEKRLSYLKTDILAETYALSIERSRRKMWDNILGQWSFLLY